MTPAELAARITRDDPALVEPLMELIAVVSDPNGDAGRYGLAEECLKLLYMRTEHFERGFRDFMERSKPDVESHASS